MAFQNQAVGRTESGPSPFRLRTSSVIRNKHSFPPIRRSGKVLPVRRAIYPGSFDPVTNGHLDVIQRAARLFDEVLVAVAYNDQKRTLLSPDERVALLEATTAGTPNVRITRFNGLLVEFALRNQASAVIRGLRAISDFEFEFQMALMNRKLEPTIETIFLMPKEEYTYLSSRIVKEIATLGGNVESFVPPAVVSALREKLLATTHRQAKLGSSQIGNLSPEKVL